MAQISLSQSVSNFHNAGRTSFAEFTTITVSSRTVALETIIRILLQFTRPTMLTWTPQTRPVFTVGSVKARWAFASIALEFVHALSAIITSDVLAVINPTVTVIT